MKKNVKLWSLIWWISLSWMLGIVVLAVDIDLKVDLTDPIQHIESVKIIQQEWSWSVEMSKIWNLFGAKISSGINVVLGENSVQNTKSSVILWWYHNNLLYWEFSTIIAWEENLIRWWTGNTILWWSNNKIIWERFSIIAGWKWNSLSWQSSTILWWYDNKVRWDNSVVVWIESSVTWNNSVSMWVNAKVDANNSFLWTNESDERALAFSDVFAVVSERGMVINSDRANDNAMLTVNWPLVVGIDGDEQNLVCEEWLWAWILKGIFTGNRYCLCSCDWNNRNSIFWQWKCQSICDGDVKPVCGTGLYLINSWSTYTFQWTCEVWYPVDWTWAYLVDKNDIVHWTCQTAGWATVQCSTWNIQWHLLDSCNFNGDLVYHWRTKTAYLESTPTWECISEQRTCNNGRLSGSYTNSSCNAWCKKPWNSDYIPHWSGIQAYQYGLVPGYLSCVSEVRTCNNGRLSGSFEYESCVNPPAECGAASEGTYYNPPSTDLCDVWISSQVNEEYAKYTWTCTNWTNAVTCSADRTYQHTTCGWVEPTWAWVVLGSTHYISLLQKSWTYYNGVLGDCQWKCDEWYTVDWDKCVIAQEALCGIYDPSDFEDLDVYTITNTWAQLNYTLMDRNLWATQVFTWDRFNRCTYWYYYQWWNNYGFPNTWDIKTSTVQVDVSWYGPNNPYSSDTFIIGHDNWYSTNPSYNNLWWNTSNNVADRQWPCPDGYHVATRTDLMNISSHDVSLDYLLPFADQRNKYWNVTNSEGTLGFYFSSTISLSQDPFIGWINAEVGEDINDYFWSVYTAGNRVNFTPTGLSIRCFKNIPNSNVTLHPNWWMWAKIFVYEGKITKLWTPTRAGYTFWWWYRDAGFTSQVLVNQAAPTHLYAKWDAA